MASLKADPTTQFSSAAYILFYRRRSTKPLGGQRFREMFTSIDDATDQGDGGSVSSSRADSPSGEGQRLEDLSRGFSSAYQEVGVAHQAGNGGPEDIQRVTTRNMVRIGQNQVEDDPVLPTYDEPGHVFLTLETDDSTHISNAPLWNDPNWSFRDIRGDQSPNRATAADDEYDDDDCSMNGNDNYAHQYRPLQLGDVLGHDLFPRGDDSIQPGTPDDDNDSMHVGAAEESDMELLEDSGTDVNVVESSRRSMDWRRGHGNDAERDEEDVHEIHP